MQSSGTITLKEIAAEFGGATPHGLTEYYGVDSGIPSSGAISIQDFYGASNVLTLTLSENVEHASLKKLLDGAYGTQAWKGKRIFFNIQADVYCYASDTGKYGLVISQTVTDNTKSVTVQNSGKILGKGGKGGDNGNGGSGNDGMYVYDGAAFRYRVPPAYHQRGAVLAGGGGGGASGTDWSGGGGGAGGGKGGESKDNNDGGAGGSPGNVGGDGDTGSNGGGAAGGAGGTSWQVKGSDPEQGGAGGGRKITFDGRTPQSPGGQGSGASGGSENANGSDGSGRTSAGGGGWSAKGGDVGTGRKGGSGGHAVVFGKNKNSAQVFGGTIWGSIV